MGQEHSTTGSYNVNVALHSSAVLRGGSSSRLLMHQESSKQKGLSNFGGQNNCFLNVILQTLWHLSSFRKVLTSLHTHCQCSKKATQTCLLCTLQSLMTNYHYGEDRVLCPDAIRSTLGELGAQENRFQLGEMDDATEALDTILQFLHLDQVQNASMANGVTLSTEKALDTVCVPRCISHALFECNMFDLHSCTKCGATSDPEMWCDTLYRIYVSEVVLLSTMHEEKSVLPTLSEAMQAIAQLTPVRTCPESEASKCDGKTTVERWTLKLPVVFGVSLVWESNRATEEQLKSVLRLIACQQDQKLDLTSVFKYSGNDKSSGKSTLYGFRGMVCYYGMHYISFFYSRRAREWFLFDDQTVRKIGTWADLQHTILRGAYQPTLLFWEREDLLEKELTDISSEINEFWEKVEAAKDEKKDSKEEKPSTEEVSSSSNVTEAKFDGGKGIYSITLNSIDAPASALTSANDLGIRLQHDDTADDRITVASVDTNTLRKLGVTEKDISIGTEVLQINGKRLKDFLPQDRTQVLENVRYLPVTLVLRRGLAPVPKTGWTCPVCTLENPMSSTECDACQQDRGDII